MLKFTIAESFISFLYLKVISKIKPSFDFSSINKIGLMKYCVPSSPTKNVSKYFFPDLVDDGLIDKQPLNNSSIKMSETKINCEVLKFLIKRFFTHYYLNRFASSFTLNNESDNAAEFVTAKTYTRLLLKFRV